jgi:ABC-type branched-subunit amino acid transport system ATPase component
MGSDYEHEYENECGSEGAMELNANELGAWVEEFAGAVTVCDKTGVILAMNARSAALFADYGGAALIGRNLLGCHPEPARTRLRELLGELNLTPLAQAPAHTLSGGERRRAEITRALVVSPKFILLDEPFAGIDPIAVSDIQKIIFHLKDRGIGVLITDHNVRETLRITDRAYIVHDGVIFKSGTPDGLAADDEVRRIYLGTEFRLD